MKRWDIKKTKLLLGDKVNICRMLPFLHSVTRVHTGKFVSKIQGLFKDF